ncbi:MAG: AbrB/MazE/SpoVT family DNA-binding domain-containing protein [Candidatus Omnitrophica bacterium]|nr:AbrB/MazE/SpoVT family DNA-binding domain-containing protein [Candidatus Omnitrophota bacterium]
MLRKLGQSYQIALPKEIVKTLHLHVDDYVDIRVKDNKVIIEPQVIIPKDQAYFYTQEWHKEEVEAQKDIKEGRVTKTRSIKELFKEMDS